MAKSGADEWEVREAGTNRVLGTYSTTARPMRGDVIELDDQRFRVRQVADVSAGEGEMQRGWPIVSS